VAVDEGPRPGADLLGRTPYGPATESISDIVITVAVVVWLIVRPVVTELHNRHVFPPLNVHRVQLGNGRHVRPCAPSVSSRSVTRTGPA
jgi:hypothetical protein